MRDLQIPRQELRVGHVFPSGQVFHWSPIAHTDGRANGGWLGTLGRRVLYIEETQQSTLATCLNAEESEAEAWEGELRDYFCMGGCNLSEMYCAWSSADRRMAAVAEALPGIRVLRQDPVECLFSFICSSNNNIGRIKLMLARLRENYGTNLGVLQVPASGEAVAPGPESGAFHFHSFPSLDQLSAATEEDLQALGLGYRAKYVVGAVSELVKRGGRKWLLSLREASRLEAKSELLRLPGVGPKVADCVALFCLDKHDAVPVDVHVWRIACRDYGAALGSTKTLTRSVGERVGDFFRSRFGPFAGWAHAVLFAAELPALRGRLPASLAEEQRRFLQSERSERARRRRAADVERSDVQGRRGR